MVLSECSGEHTGKWGERGSGGRRVAQGLGFEAFGLVAYGHLLHL